MRVLISARDCEISRRNEELHFKKHFSNCGSHLSVDHKECGKCIICKSVKYRHLKTFAVSIYPGHYPMHTCFKTSPVFTDRRRH